MVFEEDYKEKQNILLRIKDYCEKKQEETLLFYCMCLLKLYRVFYKAEKTEMLSYIHQIISPVFPLAVKYFNNRFEAYCDSEDSIKKSKILQDIEESLVILGEACEAIVQSMNGADRILVQAAPIDAEIRHMAPKLCAYYSVLLNSLTTLFQKASENDYAFCVYPSLGSRPEAMLLFSTIPERGKIGIIRIPEKDIANIQYLRMLLLHEFYHIVPGSELRFRKFRANIYLKIILYDLRSKIFDGIVIESLLLNRFDEDFIGTIPKIVVANLESEKEDGRCFYSSEIQTYYANFFINYIQTLLNKSTKNMFDCFYSNQEIIDFADYKKKMDCAEKYRGAIENNVIKLLAHNQIFKICKFYMDVFREVFADMASILTLQVSPESWFAAFRYRVTEECDRQSRPDIYIRASLVCEIIAHIADTSGKGKLGEWRTWRKKVIGKKTNDYFIDEIRNYLIIFNNIKTNEKEDGRGRGSGNKISILPDINIWKHYMKYFEKCQRKFLIYETEHHDEFEQFRKKFAINDKNINFFEFISLREWEK